MFSKEVQPLGDILNEFLRRQGLETPLLQRRLIENVDTVLGPRASHYVSEKFIRNQTLFVRIGSPIVRAELSMKRTAIVQKLNASVGTMLITDIRFC